MNYYKIIIETTHEAAELVADYLSPITGACVVDDPKTVNELIAAPSPRWDYIGEEVFQNSDRPVTVSFFIEDSADGKKILNDVHDVVNNLKAENIPEFYGSLNVDETIVEGEDWQNNWKQYFKPFSVGDKLIIRPSWETTEEHDKIELVIDPASSFGTGSHATTKMCLEHFQSLNLKNANVLDAGCGSGILACATLLFGADSVIACDIEENAMTATAENMLLNNISEDKWSTILGDLITNEAVRNTIESTSPYDLIVANIVADVLMPMLPYLKSWLKPDGRIIISGIIDTRADEVLQAYENGGMTLCATRRDAGWVMYEFKLPH